MYERHLVDVLRKVREKVRDPFAALAVLLELERRLHQRTDGVGKEAGETVEACEFLAVTLFQFGLVVPRVNVAGAAVDEQPYNSLCFGLEVRQFGRQRIDLGHRRRAGRAEHGFVLHQRCQAEQSGAAAGSFQQITSVQHIQVVHDKHAILRK